MVVEVGGEDFKAQNTYDMLLAVIKKVEPCQTAKDSVLYTGNPKEQEPGASMG